MRNSIKVTYKEYLKRLFREWYGSLSVEELTTNHELVNLIKRIESRLIGVTSMEVQNG